VRLVGCILIELLVGATLLVGTSAGAYYGRRAWVGAQGSMQAVVVPEVLAATAGVRLVPDEAGGDDDGDDDAGHDDGEDDRPASASERPAPTGSYASRGAFDGRPDEEILEPLRHAELKRVKFNQGGTSISLRVDFVGGARASFKPDQTNLQSIPRKEIAAFRLSRALGLSTVSPAVGRKFPRDELVAKLDPGSRDLLPRFYAEVPVDAAGFVTGELSHWIPAIVNGKVGPYALDSVDGMMLWRRYLAVAAPVPHRDAGMMAQLSTMVAFDFLTNNVDRFSGSNAKSSPDRRVLYFMDNTLSFGLERTAHSKVRNYLRRVQKFSRTFYEAAKTLDPADFARQMRSDAAPYEELLTDDELDALFARRDYLVRYIDGLITLHGEAAVLVYP
jgi:hypothetical protein